MIRPNTNKLGKIVTGIGVLMIIGWLFFGLKDGFHLFDRGPMMVAGIGIASVTVGLFFRTVGTVLMWSGGIAVPLAILHALLVELIDIRILAIDFIDRYSSGKIDLIVGFLGAIMVGCGFLFSRNEEDEAIIFGQFWDRICTLIRFIDQKMSEAAQAGERERRRVAHQRRILDEEDRLEQNSMPTQKVRTGRECESCGKGDGGFFSWNSTLRCKGCGMIVCTSCLKSTGLTTGACPRSGSEDLKYL